MQIIIAAIAAKTSVMVSVLPLELAAEFFDTSTLVAVSQTSKECTFSKMIAAQWGGVFARRFPCLAWLPAFDGDIRKTPLADARGVVKSLLTATPPSSATVSGPTVSGRSPWHAQGLWPGPGSKLPLSPRDSEGRALPLREEVIIAAQLSNRGATAMSHRPLLKGAIHIQDEELVYDDDPPNWLKEIPMKPIDPYDVGFQLRKLRGWLQANDAVVAETRSEHRDVMRQILQLPDEIALDLENGTTVPGDLPSLVEATCRLVDDCLRQEIFVVAGDQVWRLDALRACIDSVEQSVSMLEGNFDKPFEEIRAAGGSFIEFSPWVPLECHFDKINCAMSTTWSMGCYDYLGYEGNGDEYEEGRSPADPLVYTTETIKYCATALKLYAGWEECLGKNIVAAHAASGTAADDGHSYFCQLLASTRPVRIARAVRG